MLGLPLLIVCEMRAKQVWCIQSDSHRAKNVQNLHSFPFALSFGIISEMHCYVTRVNETTVQQ